MHEKELLKELDEELRNYEAKAEVNRENYNNEKKIADEVESELLSRQRKVRLRDLIITSIYKTQHIKLYLLEERKAAIEDRLKLTTNKLDLTNTCLETVDERRMDMVS